MSRPINIYTRYIWLVLACTALWVGDTWASSIDQLRREAAQMERSRDCEGAYKKYEELKVQIGTIRSSRKRRRLLAFVATKMARLEKCYTGCTPTEQDKKYLEQAKQYAERRQRKRAYRILVRLLRGKNPRCKSWSDAHALRRSLGSSLKTRKHQKSVDPCDLSDGTRQKLVTVGQRIRALETKIEILQQSNAKLPNPPAPPRWARKSRRGGRYYRIWLRRWKRRTRRKMRRNRYRYEYKRLMKLQRSFKDIRELRDSVWKLREDFQSCDQVYTALKQRSRSLRKSEDNAYTSIVSLYKGRVSRMQRYMRYYARKYRKVRKQQKNDKSTIDSMKRAMSRQQEFIDNVTQDLMLLSNMLVFKPKGPSEGTLLQNSMAHFQQLMGDQKKLFAAIQKRYPRFLQTAEGRKKLQEQIGTLERFEKVLERFVNKQTGDKAEKAKQTLQSVRASIMLLEKADESLAKKPVLASSDPARAAALRTSASSGQKNKNSWGWLFLVLGLSLIGGASFYLWKERQRQKLGV